MGDPLSVQDECRAELPPDHPPALLVVIDCEEDFDWRRPYQDTAFGLRSTARLELIQSIFHRFGLTPTYVVGYPIVADDEAWLPLKKYFDADECRIGAHLHPWVTPPYNETNSLRNSFAGNLDRGAEESKLRSLTGKIAERFGQRPTIYKAGRYGFGPHTADALKALGFQVDLSLMPRWSFEPEGGPSFAKLAAFPFWLDDERTLLEIPAAAGFIGPMRKFGPDMLPGIDRPLARAIRLPGVLARVGLLNRVRLTPEGVPFREAVALTERLKADGLRIFHLSFHSTSLIPGCTQYVQNGEDLRRLLAWIEDYLDFFRRRCGGIWATPEQVLETTAGRKAEGVIPVSRKAQQVQPDRIHVMVCCNGLYLQHVAVLLVSALKNLRSAHLSIVLVCSGELAAEEEAKLRQTLAPFANHDLAVTVFKPEPRFSLPLRAHYTADIYTRLWVADLLPADVSRVLYLDADMVVLGDLSEIWNHDLGDKMLGAIDIPGSDRCEWLGVPPQYGYFNSGVLLIDMQHWRQRGAFAKLAGFISDHGTELIDPDQDALNACFFSDRSVIDYRWNVTSPFFFDYHPLGLESDEIARVRDSAAILHFNGASKPWSYLCRHPRKGEYYHYLADTVWSDFVPSDLTMINRLKRHFGRFVPGGLKGWIKAGGSTGMRLANTPPRHARESKHPGVRHRAGGPGFPLSRE